VAGITRWQIKLARMFHSAPIHRFAGVCIPLVLPI
jgi:hypothetical protein